MTIIISLAVFILINLLVLMTFYTSSPDTAVAARLRGLTAKDSNRGAAGARPAEQGPIQGFLVTLGGFGFNRNEKSLKRKLMTAGMRSARALPVFLGVRTLLSFGSAGIILIPKLLSGAPMGMTPRIAFGAWVVGHFGCNYWLNDKSKGRIRKVTEALPDVLDLLVVCLEAGLGLNAAIQRVGEERRTQNDPLGQELNQAAGEMRTGRPREDALHDLGVRNGSEDLRALMSLVIQSTKLGASMGETMRAYADLLRTKRRQRAEEAARKLPIKILVPLATLLLPPLFIVVLGPAILTFGRLADTLSNR